ncbi:MULTISPECIES: anti-sigma factor [unclassified Streptomyces]|uniref:anti-sigma factor n=1 Tax=unclassified Streptomyces TaxID=2593676 RepID=UPI002251211C|nr:MULTISPECIES: anti-sigma factor [unclassified Streptomyces]MCX5139138.1 anti-sigma factor [Streptomyces sp. NBC_00338]WRZ63835.1 anti-sigma factor [Streptomyces sp. NBC_01257]WSU57799.1 anti-sigma factor [Streptomyces sp. NBC_01104]
MSDAGLHTMTGAYALHALPDSERREFERHLGDCEACSVEVRELSETATRLGLAVSAAPPRELRERVLQEIATVRQEPPSGGHRARTTSAGRTTASRTSRWPKFALAASLAAAAGFGGIAVWQNQEAQEARQDSRAAQQESDQLAQVLAAPDAQTRSGSLEDGGKGTVVVSKSQNRAVFLASGLAEAPAGKVYQLWFDDDGTMRSAGLMQASGTSPTTYASLLDGPVDQATGMGVTVEPAGGSAQPTSAPLALMNLPSA